MQCAASEKHTTVMQSVCMCVCVCFSVPLRAGWRLGGGVEPPTGRYYSTCPTLHKIQVIIQTAIFFEKLLVESPLRAFAGTRSFLSDGTFV